VARLSAGDIQLPPSLGSFVVTTYTVPPKTEPEDLVRPPLLSPTALQRERVDLVGLMGAGTFKPPSMRSVIYRAMLDCARAGFVTGFAGRCRVHAAGCPQQPPEDSSTYCEGGGAGFVPSRAEVRDVLLYVAYSSAGFAVLVAVVFFTIKFVNAAGASAMSISAQRERES
jgi:hypothetical protein